MDAWETGIIKNGSWSLVGHINYEQLRYPGTFWYLFVAMVADVNGKTGDRR